MSETNGQDRSLSTQLAERNITPAQWHTLAESLYPGARTKSVLLVIDYCKARKLDPMKKPCHIVPMKVKDQRTGNEEWRDVVMPGVYELRTTAQRTGEYMGHSKPVYGPPKDFKGVEAPEWCEMTVYRWNTLAQRVTEFPVRVVFAECVGTNREGKPNQRWAKAPTQMLTKCTEAAGLREAFPDEIGGETAAEEMDGQHSVVEAAPRQELEDLNSELGLEPEAEYIHADEVPIEP